MNRPNFTFSGMSGKEIDHLALSLITNYQPEILASGTRFDVHRFFDVNLEDLTGVTPGYAADLPLEIYGLTDSANKQVLIQEELAYDEFSQKFFRSTLAHETGHCLLHVPQLQKINRTQIFRQVKNDDSIQLYRKDNIPVYCNPEWQAWRFAGALLMPEAPLRSMLAAGAGLLEIADNFDVNISFLKTRLKALRLSN
jgi:IrrE N-terminal-like domain